MAPTNSDKKIIYAWLRENSRLLVVLTFIAVITAAKFFHCQNSRVCFNEKSEAIPTPSISPDVSASDHVNGSRDDKKNTY